MKYIKITQILLFIFLTHTNLSANTNYFNEGVSYYNNKEFAKAKFKFEQELVFNPNSEKAYLYLSKIFNVENNRELEERNLNSVILINPKNEEAVYNLAKLKLKKSDYAESKKLIDQLSGFCKNYCDDGQKLNKEIKNSFNK